MTGAPHKNTKRFSFAQVALSLVHTTTQIKTKKNVPGGTFEDKKTVFFFVFSFVLTLLLLGLISMSYAYVNVLCQTLDFIPLCTPLFSANPYACVVV